MNSYAQIRLFHGSHNFAFVQWYLVHVADNFFLNDWIIWIVACRLKEIPVKPKEAN